MSGTFNLVLGHNHPAVIAAVREQLDELVFASSSFRTVGPPTGSWSGSWR